MIMIRLKCGKECIKYTLSVIVYAFYRYFCLLIEFVNFSKSLGKNELYKREIQG